MCTCFKILRISLLPVFWREFPLFIFLFHFSQVSLAAMLTRPKKSLVREESCSRTKTENLIFNAFFQNDRFLLFPFHICLYFERFICDHVIPGSFKMCSGYFPMRLKRCQGRPVRILSALWFCSRPEFDCNFNELLFVQRERERDRKLIRPCWNLMETSGVHLWIGSCILKFIVSCHHLFFEFYWSEVKVIVCLPQLISSLSIPAKLTPSPSLTFLQPSWATKYRKHVELRLCLSDLVST